MQKLVVVNLFDIKPGKQGMYAEYLRRVQAVLARHGARVVVYGQLRRVFWGDQSQQFCGLIEYPSFKKLRTFSQDPEFLEIRKLRDESTENYLMTAIEPFPELSDAVEYLSVQA